MSRAEGLGRRLRRADTRAVLITAGVLLVAIAGQALLVSAFVAVEGLEEADRWMEHALRTSGERVDVGELEASWMALQPVLRHPPAVRVLDADGRVVEARGDWPPAERLVPTVPGSHDRPLRDFVKLRRDASLLGELDLVGGRRIELALPLSSFREEAREIDLALAGLAGVTGLAALLVSGVATSWAFAPLRRATRLVEGIDGSRLGQRLPTRHTGDPVDRHAEALNRVLAEADATFERLSAFGADVAHELRTPLNRLQNVAEVALLGGDPAELRSALQRVQATGEELARTVRSLLLLAELDEGRGGARPAPVDLDAWLARVVELYAPLFEERGSALRSSGHAGEVQADRRLLDRVLSNLLDNTLVYAATDGPVEIRVRRDGSGVAIEVDDGGPGVPEAMRERIFDRFARLDRSRAGTGTGLGLAVARACARFAGGDLRLGSSRLGGACFVWELPASPGERLVS